MEHGPNDQSPTSSRQAINKACKASRRTFAACALLNPGLLHRHAVSVDEASANYRWLFHHLCLNCQVKGYFWRLSHESLHGTGSQGSMAMDLHLECPVTLRIRDRRRNPLKRQRKVEEDEKLAADDSRRNSQSCSPRINSHHFIDGDAGKTLFY